jgi:hypothetical protein
MNYSAESSGVPQKTVTFGAAGGGVSDLSPVSGGPSEPS